METAGVVVQYIFHSGFLVETAEHILIFDYYQGPIKLATKQILVFCSHSHADHYNPQILEWQKAHPNLHYIFSDDIVVQTPNEKITLLPPYAKISIGKTEIETFGSSDLGVSFLVRCDGINIFHAGDLNWWHWWGESQQEIAAAEKLFKSEIAKIKGARIDVAFFPVDPRLEHNCSLGADYFIQELSPKVLIPMHFADNPQAAVNYASKAKSGSTMVLALTQPGQTISLFD